MIFHLSPYYINNLGFCITKKSGQNKCKSASILS
nr:MAG TPA: hypothetical protein [Bacteriophage sp.]